ncbi:MAG: DUF2959 domain-containing protein [Verrucomicrobiota bacterium]
MKIPKVLFCVGLCAGMVGCQTLYYDTMEKFGVHKREILVDRVEEAKESQEEAKEQFADAFEAFVSATEVDLGELKETYDRLNGVFKESEKRANDVRERIEGVKSVAAALFKEWEEELALYTSESLKQASEEQLQGTRRLYSKLIEVMDTAEARMQPVLGSYRDQVLFLKHNLNAQAIAALNETSLEIKDEVEALIREMEASIEEANAFVEALRAS